MLKERKIFEEIVNSGEIGTIKFYCTYDISPWTLIHFCERTISNAIKLTSIINICKLFINGIETDDLAIEERPKDLF